MSKLHLYTQIRSFHEVTEGEDRYLLGKVQCTGFPPCRDTVQDMMTFDDGRYARKGYIAMPEGYDHGIPIQSIYQYALPILPDQAYRHLSMDDLYFYQIVGQHNRSIIHKFLQFAQENNFSDTMINEWVEIHQTVREQYKRIQTFLTDKNNNVRRTKYTTPFYTSLPSFPPDIDESQAEAQVIEELAYLSHLCRMWDTKLFDDEAMRDETTSAMRQFMLLAEILNGGQHNQLVDSSEKLLFAIRGCVDATDLLRGSDLNSISTLKTPHRLSTAIHLQWADYDTERTINLVDSRMAIVFPAAPPIPTSITQDTYDNHFFSTQTQHTVQHNAQTRYRKLHDINHAAKSGVIRPVPESLGGVYDYKQLSQETWSLVESELRKFVDDRGMAVRLTALIDTLDKVVKHPSIVHENKGFKFSSGTLRDPFTTFGTIRVLACMSILSTRPDIFAYIVGEYLHQMWKWLLETTVTPYKVGRFACDEVTVLSSVLAMCSVWSFHEFTCQVCDEKLKSRYDSKAAHLGQTTIISVKKIDSGTGARDGRAFGEIPDRSSSQTDSWMSPYHPPTRRQPSGADGAACGSQDEA
ncbi:hypothetical protein IAR55_004221 [Kwoniella newhampshirensis]|uniref:Uncharacterized protein n=1 Tax=Kwoniella newhampshirensis TaxID=1651941 RepID=A0AAW0YLT6_9TREE